MGNSSSKSNKSAKKEFENFYEVIDYVATNYILTMDFKSLTKLSEREYCDKLVVLSSDIINKNFTDLEVTYLVDRIENGVPTQPESPPSSETQSLKPETQSPKPETPPLESPPSETPPLESPPLESPPLEDPSPPRSSPQPITTQEILKTKTEDLLFVDKTKLENISKDKKKYKCIGIAKYYVKIAQLFAAIVTTISPVFRYKDAASGKMVETGFLDKDKIPKNVSRNLYKLNICDNRINSLKRGHKYLKASDKNAVIYPKICSFNYNKNGILKTLSDEPGIKELAQLYFDDKYNYTDGTFSGMSTETEAQYYNDLKLFYTAFTGEEFMPSNIKTFSDIKLRDYNTKPGCKLQPGEKTPLYNKLYTLSRDDELFKQYGSNIKTMIQSAANKQQELLSVIDKLFYIEPDSNKVRIHPKLTDQILKDAIFKTRKIIMELYVKCETDYVNGLKIYEAIVESKIKQTTQNQIITLQKEANKKIDDTMNLTASLESPTRAIQPPPPPPKNEIDIANALPPPKKEMNMEERTRVIQPSSNNNQEDMYLSEPNLRAAAQAAGSNKR